MALERIDQLSLYSGNPRRGNLDAIAESLQTLGQFRPIVVDQRGVVLAGNHTLRAAIKLGWGAIDTHRIECTEDQAARIVAADNRTHDLGRGYDDPELADLLAGLEDLAGTGYTEADLDALLASQLLGPDIDVGEHTRARGSVKAPEGLAFVIAQPPDEKLSAADLEWLVAKLRGALPRRATLWVNVGEGYTDRTEE